MDQPSKMKPAIAALIVIVLVGVAVAVAMTLNNNASNDATNESTPTTQNAPTQDPTPSQSPSSTNSSYKDGTYSATGSYSTPGGRESIGATIQIKDGIITSSDLDQHAITGEAKEYQAKFASGYKASVVGKNIEDVSLTRVAGSSLTSTGFNSIIEQIKTDAAA